MTPASRNPIPDRLGIALSGLCALHCLALPFAVTLVPVLASSALGTLAGAEWFHAALLVPVTLVSGTVLGRRALKSAWLAALLVSALFAMTGALFVGEEWLEKALTLGGAGLLMFAHGLGLYARRAG